MLVRHVASSTCRDPGSPMATRGRRDAYKPYSSPGTRGSRLPKGRPGIAQLLVNPAWPLNIPNKAGPAQGLDVTTFSGARILRVVFYYVFTMVLLYLHYVHLLPFLEINRNPWVRRRGLDHRSVRILRIHKVL